MKHDPLVNERAVKPREPSLPEGGYRILHALGLSGYTSEQLNTLLELHADIKAGRIPAAPSHVRECITRALHAVGMSGLSELQMRLFIQDCQDAEP
jgi:hypothetical protein